MAIQSKAWTVMGENSILNSDDASFYISFNAAPSWGNTGHEETALCNRKDGTFYILNGDYRGAYEKIINKGYESCLKFYKRHLIHKSSWSNEL